MRYFFEVFPSHPITCILIPLTRRR